MAKFTSLSDLCKLNKTPSDCTCLGETPGGFCAVGCCCYFYLTGGFYISGLLFLTTGTPPQLLKHREGLPLALSSTLATFGCFTFARLFRHSFTTSATVLRGVFYPQAFYTLRSFSNIFGTFLWLRWGQEQPFQDPPLCLPLQSCPFRLTHGLELLILYLQDHWFINCASEPQRKELKLNYWISFVCSKSYAKTIKNTLWARLDMYCL